MQPAGCRRGRELDAGDERGEVTRAIARAKQGDPAAVRFLYLRYGPSVHGYARSIVRNEHDAEDITQQVFARLMTSIGRYEQRAVPFSAWLLRIAHNLAVDHLRRRSRVAAEPDALPGSAGETPARVVELRAELSEALAELPALQRKVVLLRHLGGYSPGEIALHLGRSEDAVHGLHHRGRRALRSALRAPAAGAAAV